MKKDIQFFLFGMGDRPKLIYKDGVLYAYPGYEIVRRWQVDNELILPAEYSVLLNDGDVRIYENESGVYLTENGQTEKLSGSALALPSFEGHPFRELLRILNHEVLINIIDGKPVPNFFVYKKPWYRDGAMMAMVLKQTGNLRLIRDWANGLLGLYDRNNGGHEESDNLGQLLYILAELGLNNHRLIPEALAESERRIENGVLTGLTDYSRHPVYQTKWLKLGLDSLHIDSSHLSIPDTEDDYAPLFWMDGTVMPPDDEAYNHDYPYLWWARKHTMRQKVDPSLLSSAYPYSSESFASAADYEQLRHLFPEYADARCAAPHTWHASEVFLYLTDLYKTEEQ